jgi:hypothetical protein
MPNFKAPQYTKVVNPKTGTQEPCYTFNIEFSIGDYLSFIAEREYDISLSSLQKCVLENVEWWNAFIKQFLDVSAKYFQKPYTVEAINKITKHTLEGNFLGTVYPTNVVLVPKNIQISGGVFTVNWKYDIEPMIDIPDADEVKVNTIELPVLPVSKKAIEGVEELNIDEIPAAANSTEELEIDSPAKFYEKQRVKEARLKAKLALYKAQRQTAQYYEKYGENISDSDSDFESSDGETSEEDEVQL